jgi:hypothetical protein
MFLLAFINGEKKFGYDEHMSNVIDGKKRCQWCGKLKKWVAAKSENYGHRRLE